MKDDPTIKAVRDARHRISGRVGHDPRKLVEYYRLLQDRHRQRLVSQPTKSSETDGDNAA
jgi:hypothetical protein